jgi:non-homologous end joining protein Ku
MESVPQIEQKEVNKDELKLSISLVESMTSSLENLDLTD